MRKLLASLALLAALGGAGAVVAAPASASPSLHTASFNAAMRARGYPVRTSQRVAKNFCKMVDASDMETAFVAMAQIGMDAHVDAKVVGYIIGAGVPAFCPRHQAALDALGA
jgi:hypothetical protein